MNIEQIKTARDDLSDWNKSFLNSQAFLVMHRETIRTLLDQAINAPDLEKIDEMIAIFIKDNYPETHDKRFSAEIMPSDKAVKYFNLLRKFYDHLAPRIVREGFVVVPEEPTEEMLCAGYNGGDVTMPRTKNMYKAMIATSKGD